MKIIIACGGSGGHLFPGIAVAQQLKNIEKDCQILIIASRRGVDRRVLIKENYPFIIFPAYPMPDRISFKGIYFLMALLHALVNSFILLWKTKPNLVLGFGGFISGPILLCAYLLRVPTVVHEQNVIPGRTNLILARFVDAIAISFKESGKFFKHRCKLVFTGNPIRNTLNIVNKKQAAETFGFEPEKFSLLVMGGSQGAHPINEAMMKVFEKFGLEERRKFQVIHISGQKDYQMLQTRYQGLGINSCIYNFLEEIDKAYCASDLVISRAGATAISEITFFGKVSILIPYPYARSHQLANARYMSEHNMSILIEEDGNLIERLYDKILYFYKNKSQLQQLSNVPKIENAARNLADLVLNLKSDDKH